MVFQSYALYPHMTVAENMGFSLKWPRCRKPRHASKWSRRPRCCRSPICSIARPKALSGGQRQRVAIGRAIVRSPQVFLFDEPLSNLDAGLRVQMRVELTKLHKELGSTMIYVTHDQVEAMTMGDRIAVFNGGYIEQVGTPLELYQRPANVFVAQFLGSPRMNVLPATARAVDGGVRIDGESAGFVLPGDGVEDITLARLGEVAQVGIRPESVTPVGRPHCRAGLEGAHRPHRAPRRHGAGLRQHRRAGRAAEPQARCRNRRPWQAGMDVNIHPKTGALYLFDESGKRIGSI